MHSMRSSMIFLLVAIFLAPTGKVHAGERKSAITFSPFVGAYTFDGAERLESRPVVGVRLGYSFSSNFALEGTFSYVPSCFTKNVPGTVNVFNHRLEAVYNFMPDREVVPYLVIGGGETTLNMPHHLAVTHPHNHSPTINAGGGIKWYLNENMAIRADYHQNFLIDTSDADNRVQDVLANYEFSIGLHILFGGK